MTTLIENLVQVSGQPLVHALGWTLLHFCWEGTLVAIILWCVLGLLGGRASQARYGASCLALVLMVALPLLTFARIAAAEYAARATISGPAIEIDPGMTLLVGVDGPPAPWPLRIASAIDQSIPWVLLLWLAGLIVFVARLNFGLMVARRMKSAATHAPPADLLRKFEELKIRLGIARAARLMHSALVEVPTVIGWLRPVVLIPVSCLTGLSAAQIEAILCHELAHVRRHDYLVSVLQSMVEALLFYHPAVWWVSKQVRRERECCCDELAVGIGGDVLAYARALSALEERRASFPEFVLGANGGALKMRIKRLLGRRESAAASHFAAFAVLAVILAVAGSYVATVAHAQAKAQAAAAAASKAPAAHEELALEQPPADLGNIAPVRAVKPLMQLAQMADTQDLSPLYRNWLTEDAVWIITPEERAAFLKLANDEERDQFITQFWARRDPPGSAPGAFKEEHYARIAYANQHFATDSQPGWKTDRGRVYIVLGKPFSIDSHPSGGPFQAPAGNVLEMPPFEVWHYQASGGTGQQVDLTFADRAGNGNYRLSGPIVAPQERAALTPPPAPATPFPDQPLRVSAGVAMSMLISKVEPVYPDIAKAAHVQGMVVLHAVISNSGTVERLNVISGAPMLISSAMEAARQWTYKPYLLNGEPQEVDTTIAVNFHLNADGTTNAGPADPDPLRISAGVAAGMLISKVDPIYPPEARAAGVQGAVVLKAILSAEGKVESLQVIGGPPQLTGSALDAVKQWRYTPYLLNGQPTEVQTTITVNFSLTGSSDLQTKPTLRNVSYQPQASPQPAQAPDSSTGLNIRSINFKGLNSVTISEVTDRFNRDAIGLKLETPYDPARIARAAASLKDLLAEHGHPSAIIQLVPRTIPPGAVGILFEVKEGPKTKLAQPVSFEPRQSVRLAAQVQAAAPPAQGSGAISGTIYDPTGALVPRAKVTATNTDTGAQVTAETGNSGTYSFSPLLPGNYNVMVEAKGFQRQLQENVHVKSGQKVGLNLKLSAGAFDQTLTVMGKPLAATPPPTPPPPPAAAAGKPVGPQRVSSGMIAGLLLSKVDPVYPEDAKAAHVQGTVVLRAIISKTGTIEKVSVVSGPPALIVSAIDAVRQWKYKPSLLNGEPTEVETTININFTLGPPDMSCSYYDGGGRAHAGTCEEDRANAGHYSCRADDDTQLVQPQAGCEWKVKRLQDWQHNKQSPTSIQIPLPSNAGPAQSTPQQYGSASVRKIGGDVSRPLPIYEVEPEFTEQASKAKASGTVLVGLVVDQQGLPQNVHVLRGLGIGPDGKPEPGLKKAVRAAADGMNQNAIDAVKQYKFKPAMEDGKPVPVHLNVEVNFKIF